MLVAGSFGEPRPRESWRRYLYVLDRARAFAAAGRPTLRGFVDWLESLQEEQRRDVSPALTEDDENAVRVLTVHGSKGLEFPVVILTGWGSSRPSSAGIVVVDRVKDQVDVGIGARDGAEKTWTTHGYDAAERREKELGDAESIRLSYVAATRARDHLIVSLYRRVKDERAQAIAFEETLSRSKMAKDMDLSPISETRGLTAEQLTEDVRAHVAAEKDWASARDSRVRQLAGLHLLTATGLKQTLTQDGEEADRPNPPRFPRGRGGTALGRAVHAVLQVVDLATLADVTEIARAQAGAEGIPGRAAEVERLARAACETEPIRRAVASGRYWREVPVGARIGEVTLEGFIDLLYESDEEIAIVDYKTDDVSPRELERRFADYRLQGGTYALLVETVLGVAARRVEFVFARAGSVRTIEDVSRAAEDAKAAVADLR
jgi:ATP-dependent exoDNAse (exonuclease V) beta subunit